MSEQVVYVVIEDFGYDGQENKAVVGTKEEAEEIAARINHRWDVIGGNIGRIEEWTLGEVLKIDD